MKIAYVTEAWPPALNGVALASARVVSHLRMRGHGVDLVRPRQHAEDAGDMDTITLPTWQMPLRPGLSISAPVRQRLLKRWREMRPDVVHVATQGPLGWSACSAARALAIPVTSDFHTRFESCSNGRANAGPVPMVRAYLRGFHNRTACTFVASDEAADMLSGHGFRNLVVSGRGVDTVAFSPYHRSESLRRRWGAIGPVVLYVGPLAADRNLMTLVKAFEAIRAAEPAAQLVVIGDGSMRQELEEHCPEAIFAGSLSGPLLSTYYASADMVLSPSLEAEGNVMLEAMASGVPVVTYDSASAPGYIQHEVNGMAVPVGDQFAFVRAAVTLACDEPLRERLGASACLSARAASWAHTLGDFERTLHATAYVIRSSTGMLALPESRDVH